MTNRTGGWSRLAALVALILIGGTSARAGDPIIGGLLGGAATVELQDGQGQALRSVNGTLFHEGIIVPLTALKDAAKAQVKTREGKIWTVENALASNTGVNLALLELPETPAAAFTFPDNGAFMPGSRITLLGGPGSDPDSLGATIYYTFQLRDRTDFVAVSPGLAGAAPAVDPRGRLLGVTGDLSEPGYSLGYLVPMVSVRVVVSSAGAPVPLSTLAQASPALWTDRNTTSGLAFRGALLTTAGKHEEARNFLTLALKKDPTFADAHFWMGRTLFSQMQNEAAAAEFQKAAEADPSFRMAWHMAGAAFNQAAKYLDAEKMYNKALEVDPNSAETYCNLGGAYFNQRRFDKAIDAFRKSIDLDPYYSQGLAYSNLAMTYTSLGQRVEAEGVYSELLKVNADWAKRLRAALDGQR